MKVKYIFFCLITLILCNSGVFAQSKDKINKIVIDAGHGGTDPGCIGKMSKEKNVTLSVALKLGALIEEHMPEVQTIYTRKTDVAVELFKRAKIANDHHADLFISIHCNAAENRSAHGVETWVVGLDKSAASIEVARKENAAMLLEEDYENNYDGYDPNSTEANAILSMYVSAYLKNSALLASKVQNNLLKSTKLTDRSVRQAGFWVLYKVAMPSILIELGFLSNAVEEKFLIQESNQNLMAISIYNAVAEYKNAQDGTQYPTLSLTGTKINTPKKEEIATKTNPEKPTVKAETQPNAAVEATPQNGIRFRVQIASSRENINVNDARFSKASSKKVLKYFENNVWKYTAGDETTFEGAQAVQKTLKTAFPDCFIVAFKDNKKIPVTEARDAIKK